MTNANTGSPPVLVSGEVPPGRMCAPAQVVVGILRVDDRLLLVRRQRDRPNAWTPPGGVVHAGELVTEALTRQIREKTGLRLAGMPQLAFTVNTATSTGTPTSMLAMYFDCYPCAGVLNHVHDPGGGIAEARLATTSEAIGLLAGSSADRAETEPVLAYLSGNLRPLWCYRNDEPATPPEHDLADVIATRGADQ
ncbi:ADP-ribose pyrophosphatase YjhB (NUDIX family) [Hamadaea flava]|uniref:NUDIX domain-containing protein n=1 Tax=Hamadaea flava TaxID=1742688 RepID=A0ABV8LKI6_9ACTN|nr:NUDIX hydrolase [Hamadaea flava]MCP2323578.1 ADP-ribose pyrophosphatase YjhB (NUDIX family) [Hamadaea flava]